MLERIDVRASRREARRSRPSRTTLPTTDACCATRLSGAGSPSRREPIIACRLVGTGRARRGPPLAVERRPSRRACGRSPRGRAGCPPRCVSRSSAWRPPGSACAPSSSARSASLSVAAERSQRDRDRVLALGQSCGRRLARAPAAPKQMMRTARRPRAEKSSRSKSVGSAQCRSSKTSTSGRCSGEQLEHAADAPVELGLRDLGRGVRAARRRRHADQVRERRRHRAELVEVVARRAARAASPSFAETVVDVVALEDAGGALEDLDHRPVRDALAVREAAAPEHVGCLRGALRDLGHEPALADAGRRRRPSRAPACALNRLPEREQALELGLAPDERRVVHLPARGRLAQPEGLPDAHRLGLALRRDRLVLGVLDRVLAARGRSPRRRGCRRRAPPTRCGRRC